MKAVIWGILALFLLTMLPVEAKSCAVHTPQGMLEDQDCDGIPSVYDNCPESTNFDQRDLNRNRVGDVCEAPLQEVMIKPDAKIRQGDAAEVVVSVVNKRPRSFYDIKVTVRNRDLNIDEEKHLGYVPAGEQATVNVWFKVPECASLRSYPLTIITTYSYEGDQFTETTSKTMTVQEGRCDFAAGFLDNTIIDTLHEVTVDTGSSTEVPLTITNFGDSATYELSVIDPAGVTWRIEPTTRVSVQEGESKTVVLFLEASKNAQPGIRNVDVVVVSGKQRATVAIKAYVRSAIKDQREVALGPLIFNIIFIIALLVLIIAAITIASKKRPKKTVSVEKTDKKLETYY